MNILITGANGFLGRNLVSYLSDNTEYRILTPSSKELDLLEPEYQAGAVKADVGYLGQRLTGLTAIVSYFQENNVDAVIHLAGVVGGIGRNDGFQGELGYKNLQMGLNVLEACRLAKVKKLIMLGTTCSYPNSPKTIPFVEDELFDGMPEITNSGYGIAKRALIKLTQEYHDQYELNVTNLIPTNLYGEYDSFDESKSHVIPAIIKKFEHPQMAAAECMGSFVGFETPVVEIWGDGSATRDFLHVHDCVRAISICLEKDTGSQPINLGSGCETSIKELVEKVQKIGQYTAEIDWDNSKPNGQPRRCLDITRAKNVLRWQPQVTLNEGLRKTIDWYRNNEA
jgi:nucleoside-diphosphate-sugar epimerase